MHPIFSIAGNAGLVHEIGLFVVLRFGIEPDPKSLGASDPEPMLVFSSVILDSLDSSTFNSNYWPVSAPQFNNETMLLFIDRT